MAVKKHELVNENRNKLDLVALDRYIQLMNEQPNYIPAPNDLVKNCQDIVKCLSRTRSDDDQLWEVVQTVQMFLHQVVTKANDDLRRQIVSAILSKFYSFISDPQSDACPATSVVLIVFDESNFESTMAAARWLVQQGDSEPAGAGHRAALSCLYRWMYSWHYTPTLGHWVLAFIKALEENARFEVLTEVTIDNLARLFLGLEDCTVSGENFTNVIFHVMSSLRQTTDALDRITPLLRRVLCNLAADSRQWSRQMLQNVVDITKAMVDELLNVQKTEEDQENFREKYSEVFKCLERHMASRDCNFLQIVPWKPKNLCHRTKPNALVRKVGLLNLGNTCYMNSVLQALLLTRQFSTHVMLHMSTVPYWSKVALMFAKMLHSITCQLNPGDFLRVVKPPFFQRGHQHDSSEFLGYLFELLQSYENCNEADFEYTFPPVLTGASRLRTHAQISPTHSSSDSEYESAASQRAISPRPSGSSSAGSSSGYKRQADYEPRVVPPKKRSRANTDYHRKKSFIDEMFGGVLLTRVECTECHSSSLSRDVFRELQLAFPEKQEDLNHSVQGLLEYFCSKEMLTGDNKYACQDCGGLRDAERTVLIETTPKYLILVLKNFKFEPKIQVQTKLMMSTYYNLDVTLPTVRSQSQHVKYWLYAAVVHAGTMLDSGHYFTLGKENDKWYTFNDDTVDATVEAEVNAFNRCSTPYILFYRRVDIEEGAAPSIQELPPLLQEAVAAHNKHYVDTVRKVRMSRQ